MEFGFLKKSWWGFGKKKKSKDYLYIRDIIIKYLDDSKITKLYAPNSGDCILQNQTASINILVSDGRMVIANHKFLINKEFSIADTDKLKEMIKDSIERDRQKLKEDVFQSEIDILRHVFRDVYK